MVGAAVAILVERPSELLDDDCGLVTGVQTPQARANGRKRRSVILRAECCPNADIPTGYAALVQRYDLRVVLTARLTALAMRHHPSSTAEWLMLTPRHRPEQTLAGQLQFAFRWEGIDLGILSALFRRVDAEEIAMIVRGTPTGGFARRLWFLYEWLTEVSLDVPDPGKVGAVSVVNTDLQYGLGIGLPSSRHKVLDNLPGTRRFCPLVRRSTRMQVLGASRLDERAKARVLAGIAAAESLRVTV